MGLFYNGNKFQYAVPQQSLPFGELRRGSYYDALIRPVTVTPTRQYNNNQCVCKRCIIASGGFDRLSHRFYTKHYL